MKPSERILALENEEYERIVAQLNGEQPPDHVKATFRCVAGIRGLTRYLDEQHELEERRSAFRNALALVGPGAPIDAINEQLHLAGVDSWDVCAGMTFEGTKDGILRGAREAGLL
jgi:hypothetical protein